MRKFALVCLVGTAFAAAAEAQSIDKRVLDQVKDATVFVKLKIKGMQGSGSGWVLETVGDVTHIITNRHVAVPDPSEIPEGTKVELSVVFRSGTPQQQEVPATLVAYDRREVFDLAMLEVKGVRSPPAPIRVNRAAVEAEAEFSETMPVYTLGFPLGSMIQGITDKRGVDPAITVTTMSISSLRRDEMNRLARVQLNGPLIEGNSGGPIVDAKGRLVGVAVSRLRGEAVGFAIPPTMVANFLRGDFNIERAELLAPSGMNAQLRLVLKLVDPLKRVKAVSVRSAPQAGASPLTPTSNGTYPLMPSSVHVAFKIENGLASGILSIPSPKLEDRKQNLQVAITFVDGVTLTSKPLPIELPDRQGVIAGLVEDAHAKTLAKFSCEVNIGDDVKIVSSPGKVMINVPGGAPLTNAPQFKLFNAPCALVRVKGDFLCAVTVTNEFDPGGTTVALPSGRKLPFTFQGAGLLLWQDEKNFIRLERCKGSDGDIGTIHRVLVEIYKNGREAGVHYTKALPDRPVVLAARRKGSTVQFLYAESKEEMVVFQEVVLDFDPEIFVGLSASTLSKLPFQAKFERFTVKSLEDGKDIEAKPVAMTRLIDTGGYRKTDGTWVLEGAGIKVLKAVGGSAAPQTNMDQFKGKWTANRQLLWKATGMGDALTLEVPVENGGAYEVKAKFTIAPDYGKVKFSIDGRSLLAGKPTDLFNTETRPAKLMSLGTTTLGKGKHRFVVTLLGKNPKSSGYSFGLDEIQLVPQK